MIEIAGNIVTAIVVIAVIGWLLWVLVKFVDAKTDGELDAIGNRRSRDYHVGFWKGVYDTAYDREKRKQRLAELRTRKRS